MSALADPLDLSSESCTAHAFAHGAHLVGWTPAGSAQVLWLSPLARFESGVPIRGGVPVILPWFGSGASGRMSPSHGFGRTSEWQLTSLHREPARVTAEFELDSTMVPSEESPHGFRATYRLDAGEQLHLELTVANTGVTEFTFEEALHTYLAVGDVRQVTIEGLGGAEYVDKVPGAAAPSSVQSGAVTLGTRTDRVYRSSSVIRVVDPVLDRVLVITTSGTRSTIVWNPGAQLAAQPAMADVGADHWHEFVCVEGGNVAPDAITLAPGSSTTMSYGIRVEAVAPER